MTPALVAALPALCAAVLARAAWRIAGDVALERRAEAERERIIQQIENTARLTAGNTAAMALFGIAQKLRVEEPAGGGQSPASDGVPEKSGGPAGQ